MDFESTINPSGPFMTDDASTSFINPDAMLAFSEDITHLNRFSSRTQSSLGEFGARIETIIGSVTNNNVFDSLIKACRPDVGPLLGLSVIVGKHHQ